MKSVFFVAAVLLAGCSHREAKKASAAGAPAIAVRVVETARVEWPTGYEATGTVRARASAPVSSKVTGYIRQVRVRAGDRVRARQTLVTLDARDLDAAKRQAEAARLEAQSAREEARGAVAAAEAQLELMRTTHGRMQDLFQKKSISNQEYDEASARLKSAKAAYDMAVSKARQADARIQQANAGLNVASITASYAAIRAPFDGIVTERHADPGALATPGAPLLVVEKTVGLRLEAHVEESRVPSVKEGAQVAVVIDALGITATGKVAEIVPSVDAAARSFLTKIDLPAIPHLRPGMFGRVTFAGGSDEVVAVPAAAISETGQVQSVFVVEDGVARVRLITRGRQKDEQVEVLTGLGGGEKVISPRPAGLRDGARVEVRP